MPAPDDNKVRGKRGLRKPGGRLVQRSPKTMFRPDFERETYRRMAARHQIDQDSLLANFPLPEPRLPMAQALRCYPVRSYIQTVGTLNSSTFPRVVVPAFAVHWGVVVGPTIYHLEFEDGNDADLESHDPSRVGTPICFTFTKWKRPAECLEALPIVGNTKFEHIQVCEIGEKLVEEFGNYHRLFWNCQVFAKCFLRLITGGNDFDKLCKYAIYLTVVGHPQMLQPSSFAASW